MSRSWRVPAVLAGCAMVLVAIVSSAHAQEGDMPTLARSYTLHVKDGHDAQFVEGMKKQIEWYKKNDETWHWHAWQWDTGEHAGDFVFRSPGHHWKDLDDRAERTERASAHFREHVRPHLDSMHAGISQALYELSRWPEMTTMPAMVTVYEMNVHYGMTEEFINVISKIHKAIEESDWPVNYGWSMAVSGGEMPTFYLVIPHDSWADMKGPEKPFLAMLEETVGRADAGAIMAGLRECVRRQETTILRFREDLSYIPGGE